MTRVRSLALITFAAAIAGSCRESGGPGAAVREVAAPPASIAQAPPPPSAPPPDPPPPASSPAPPAPSTPPPKPFALIELAPTQGDLLPLLRDEVGRAKAKSLRPVVEFYADWCPPCKIFDRSMHHPAMEEALAGIYLIKLNLDDWHDKLPGTGFTVKTIPQFYLLGESGRPTGKMLDGDKWGRPTPAIMATSLKAFFAG
jgi:thiol-disulfide isomerase/thioredoxin